jgi:hypothetical protein
MKNNEAEKIFLENRKIHNNRCYVKLPFKRKTSESGTSLKQALRRFYSLENKLEKIRNTKKPTYNS